MSEAVCPYCRGAIVPEEAEPVLCPGCSTPHHADCFEENGGCTVFGCSAAPPAEPKLTIGAPDLQAAVPDAPAPPAAAVPAPPPPPPLLASAGGASSGFVPVPTPAAAPLFSSLGYGTAQFLPPQSPNPPFLPYHVPIDTRVSTRNRTTFLLLGVLLGAFGAHSFYAGSTRKGFIQLGITVLTFGFAGMMVWIWAIIDICTISKDNEGIPFRN